MNEDSQFTHRWSLFLTGERLFISNYFSVTVLYLILFVTLWLSLEEYLLSTTKILFLPTNNLPNKKNSSLTRLKYLTFN